MPCPVCGSNELWDDELWWGCANKACDFMTNQQNTNLSPNDRFNGESIRLIPGGGWVPTRTEDRHSSTSHDEEDEE